MGHGNYLMSEWLDEKVKQKAYDGREEVSIRFEIRFDKWSKEFHPYKNYESPFRL